jgi:hypothetical protein
MYFGDARKWWMFLRELPKEIEPLFDLEMRLWGATLTRLGIFVWGNIVMKIGFVTIVYV